jgi:AraC-like DNA-binding protein
LSTLTNLNRRPVIIDSASTTAGGAIVTHRDGTHVGAHPTAIGALTRLAYEQAKAAGIDLGPLLKRANLPLSLIENQGARLRVRDQISFLNLVADDLGDDFIGFHLALRSDLREIGWLYYIMASSETACEALQRAARYASIVNEGLSLNYADKGDVVIKIQHVGISRHMDRHQIEFVMTFLVRICRHLTGLRLAPAHVKFIHRRVSAPSDFLELLGGNVQFGATVDEIAFATTIKNTPIASADPYLSKLLITYYEEALYRRANYRGSFRSLVENAIVPLLPHGRPPVGEIARRLGISQRTFARRLSLEGLTYSKVLEHLRSNLAERYLTEDNLSISEIAWLLGYQEVGAFTHAFKRWTGKTPRKARLRAA